MALRADFIIAGKNYTKQSLGQQQLESGWPLAADVTDGLAYGPNLEFEGTGASAAVYPDPSEVQIGVTYGPNGNDYTGTYQASAPTITLPSTGGPSGSGMYDKIMTIQTRTLTGNSAMEKSESWATLYSNIRCARNRIALDRRRYVGGDKLIASHIFYCDPVSLNGETMRIVCEGKVYRVRGYENVHEDHLEIETIEGGTA